MEWRFNSPKYHKLAQLISSGRRLNITQLCRESGFVPSHLSIVLNWYKDCGLIEKRVEESRKTYAEFTEFGKRVFEAYEKWAELANEAIRNREKLMEKTT